MLKLISDLNTLSVLCEVCDTSIMNRVAASFTFTSGLRLAHEVKNAIATIEVCDPRAAECGGDAADDALLVVSTTAVFIPQNFRGKTLSVRETVRLLTDENARVGVSDSSESFVAQGFDKSNKLDDSASREPKSRWTPSATTRSAAMTQGVSERDAQSDDDDSMSSEEDYI